MGLCILYYMILQAMHKIGKRTRLLWMLQDPVAHEKLNPDRAAITNDQLDLYNMAAMEVYTVSTIRIGTTSQCTVTQNKK